MTNRRIASSACRPGPALAVALALALGVAAPPRAAHAQSAADVAAARDLFREGSQLARDEKWPEARDRFERSLKLKRAAITLYSLAVAQQKTGLDVEALESFRAFLAEPTSPGTEPYLAPARESVDALDKRVARISIRVEPADAPDLAVAVDGQPIPASAYGRPRLVNAGTHEVSAKATGYRPAKSSVTVALGGAGEVRLSLERAPVEPGPKPLVPLAPTASADPATPGPDATPSRVLPLSLIIGGATVSAAGLVVGVVGLGKANDAPTRDGPDASSARTTGVVADVMIATGLVAAGAGVVLWLVQGPPKTASARAGRR